jgi:hypothetical protein
MGAIRSMRPLAIGSNPMINGAKQQDPYSDFRNENPVVHLFNFKLWLFRPKRRTSRIAPA